MAASIRSSFARVAETLLVLALAGAAFAAPADDEAKAILDATGVKGGLVVHVGCGDGKLTAALGAGEAFRAHGIDADPANVEQARKNALSLGLYGKVAFDRYDGKTLPYIENLVNLLVVSDAGALTNDEMLRVLAPGGVACVRKGQEWTKTVKPHPADTDDWTHYLYDASNSAVSKDMEVAPPRHLQWISDPRYSRHHDHMSCISAMVTTGGRVFYIFDYGSPQSIELPSDWRLVARDAYNGTFLWSTPIATWEYRMRGLKSGPTQLTRRLVAVGDRVWVTLGLRAPVSELDAAGGRALRTYEGSAGAEEIIVEGGTLFAMINNKAEPQPDRPALVSNAFAEGPRRVAAWEADTGKLLWSSAQPDVMPLTLSADAKRVVFHDGEKVVCLNRADGKELWRSAALQRRSPIPTSFAPTLELHGNIVLFSGGGTAKTAADFEMPGNTIHALSLADGKEIWQAPQPLSGHRTAQDALVLGGVVYMPNNAKPTDSGETIGLDLLTGEVKKKFLPDVKVDWFHHRCYRAKGTERFLMTSRAGIEFIDPVTQHWEINHWVRGGCLYGVMPANGMVYDPPHPCACFLETKLWGFNALAPASPSRDLPKTISEDDRLEKGAAFGKIDPPGDPEAGAWPMHRHDARRSGSTSSAVPTELHRAWQADLGGKLTAPVVAGGKVFVAEVDRHVLQALSAVDGSKLWSFQAGGRIDSATTVWRGCVLFGSADGYVYSLRASDGALEWRFRAAPVDRRLSANDQVESVWPVSGSVLVEGGALYCVAGRWKFVDGGMRLLKLDPATGKKLAETVLDNHDAEGNDLQTHVAGLNMPVGAADILVSDGKTLFLKTQEFDLDGKARNLGTAGKNTEQQGEPTRHLSCPTGLLDDTWWHRSYWIFGDTWKSGAGGYFLSGRVMPAGRPLVFNDAKVFGYARKPNYYRWTTPMEYQLFESDLKPEVVPTGRGPAQDAKKGPQNPPPRKIATDWTLDVPVLARAMVLADKTLFLAGAPDVLDEVEALRSMETPETQKALARQAEALDGKEGGLLWAVSSEGKKLAEWKLDTVPVFDGLIAANGRLYLTLRNGKVESWAK